MERVCCQCEFWDPRTHYKNKRNTGLCRFDPPIRNGGDDEEFGWPLTYDEDWCGKFTSKEELPRQKMHDPVSAYEEQSWRSRGDSEQDIAARIAARGRA